MTLFGWRLQRPDDRRNPRAYTLGAGHCRFFYARCAWLADRYNELVENERKFGETIQEVERVKQRESLVNSFRDSLPEGSAARALFESTTAQLAPPSAPPQAPPSAPASGNGTGDKI